MLIFRRHFMTALLAMLIFASPAFADALMTLETKYGKTVIKLRPDLAPKHVEQITALANRHFYDNVVFHRVIDGFMAQTGDPTGTGRGKSDLPNIPAEFSKEKFIRVLSAWRAVLTMIAQILSFSFALRQPPILRSNIL